MTVRVTLKAANYQWLRQGLQSYGQPLMVSPEAVKKYGNDGIALHPIGPARSASSPATKA